MFAPIDSAVTAGGIFGCNHGGMGGEYEFG